MRRLTRLFPVVMGGAKTPYDQLLINTYGASEVWPLVDIASGTAITAKVAAARNGTLTGWDLQNAAGPVAGTLAPLSGTNDLGSIFTASLVSAFDGTAGSLIIWCKHTDWTTTDQYGMHLYNDVNNFVRITHDAANRLSWQYYAGGTALTRTKTSVTSTAWMCLGITWDKAADEVRCYYNGVQEGVTLTSLGVWSGNIQYAGILSFISANKKPWIGHGAYAAVKFGGVWTPTQMQAMYLAANPT